MRPRLRLLGAGVVTALAVPVLAVGALSGAASYAAEPKPDKGDGSVTITPADQVDPGDVVSFHGEGFAAGGSPEDPVWQQLTVKLDDTVQYDKTVQIRDDGTFDGQVTLPADTADGQHWLRFLGSAPAVSKHTEPFTVGATEPADPQPTDPTPSSPADPSPSPSPTGTRCTPTTAEPTVTVAKQVAIGGLLHVTGTGWCHPTDGGSVIGVKIDEGAYDRVGTPLVAGKPDVFAVIRANAKDGTFAADIRLPDGTTTTSTPAFPTGAHTLRLLSGSIKSGDEIRTVQSAEFVVGAYRPNGMPEPVSVGQLSTGVDAWRVGTALHVHVKGGKKGDWVFLSGLAPDGSPRYPWGEKWFRLGSGGLLVTGLGSTPMTGENRVVVQDGNQGHVGELLGWDTVVFPDVATAGTTATDGATAPATTSTATAPTTTVSPAVPPAAGPAAAPTAPAGLTNPAPPVESYADLLLADRLPGSLRGKVLTIRLPGATSGPVFVDAYDESRLVPGGWARPDERGRIKVDLHNLPAAAYRVTVQGSTGDLIGWADADLTPLEPAVATRDVDGPATTAALSSATPSADRWFSATDGWLLGLGAALLAGVALGLVLRRGGAA